MHGWAKAHFAGNDARDWLRLIAMGCDRKKELELGFQKSVVTWGRIAKPEPSLMAPN